MDKLSKILGYIVLGNACIEIFCFLCLTWGLGFNVMIENVAIDIIFLITFSSFVLTVALVSFRIANKFDFKYYLFILFISCITWIIPLLLGIMFYQMREVAN